MKQREPSRRCSIRVPGELSRYLDHDLSPRRWRRVERHLQSCSYCRKQLAQMRAVRSLLRRAPDVQPPRDFTLSAEAVPARAGKLWYPRLRAATTVLAVLVLAIFALGLSQPARIGLVTLAPRAVAATPTPRVTSPPASVAVAPAITRRPAPTGVGILATPYPGPSTPPARIEGTVSPAEAGPSGAPPAPFHLWPVLEVVGLSLLGVMVGLTWLAYRQERHLL